jgi:hypothetical protein
LCLASKAFRKFARQISLSLSRPREQKNALREQEEEKKEEKSTGDDEKTGRVYCVIIFTMGNGVEKKKKKKKGIRVNSHEDGDIWRDDTQMLAYFFFSVWQSESVLLYRRELIPSPSSVITQRNDNKPPSRTYRERGAVIFVSLIACRNLTPVPYFHLFIHWLWMPYRLLFSITKDEKRRKEFKYL